MFCDSSAGDITAPHFGHGKVPVLSVLVKSISYSIERFIFPHMNAFIYSFWLKIIKIYEY